MIKVSDVFEVKYGHSLELNRLKLVNPDSGIAFVSRKMDDNGISAYVERIPGVEPAPAGFLSCALGGNGVLTTHLQEQPFYVGRDVSLLKPRFALTNAQLLYYCMCIKANRFRYSYGRQANRTLKDLLIPDLQSFPSWVGPASAAVLDHFSHRLNSLLEFAAENAAHSSGGSDESVSLSEIFDVRYGHSLELNRLEQVGPNDGGIPFISRKMGDNGVAAFVRRIVDIEPAAAGELSCALSGNGVLSTFVQDQPFYTAFHIACLRPKFDFSHEQLFYYCTCIWGNRHRYSFGRQANRTLRDLLLPAPSKIPGWVQGGLDRVVRDLAMPLEKLKTLQ